jgi:hypothetical protein
MNIEKVNRVIELQRRANMQIEMYGEADHVTTAILLELVDSLTREESEKVLELSNQTK